MDSNTDKYGDCLCLAVDLICLKARLSDSGEKGGWFFKWSEITKLFLLRVRVTVCVGSFRLNQMYKIYCQGGKHWRHMSHIRGTRILHVERQKYIGNKKKTKIKKPPMHTHNKGHTHTRSQETLAPLESGPNTHSLN